MNADMFYDTDLKRNQYNTPTKTDPSFGPCNLHRKLLLHVTDRHAI